MLSPHAIAPFIIALINSFMAIRKIPLQKILGAGFFYFYFDFSLMIFAKRKTPRPLTRFRLLFCRFSRFSDLCICSRFIYAKPTSNLC